MKFTTVSAENFMSYKQFEFDLSSQGMLLVLGQNKDADASSSNGSGKTAIIDAFTFALWGTTLRGISGDAMVNRSVGKNCVAQVTFVDDNGVTYKVTRYRKHTQHQNMCILESDEVDMTGASVVETQKVINELVGLDFPTATQSLILGQGPITNFTDATDAERKHVLDLILGLHSLEKCLEVARQEKRNLEKDIGIDSREIELLENQARTTAEEIVALRDRVVNFETRRQTRMRELQSRITEIVNEADRFAEEQEETILAKKAEILRIDEQTSTLGRQLAKRDAVRQTLLQKNDEEVRIRSAIQMAELTVGTEQDRIDYLESTEGTSCPLCEKPLTEEEKRSIASSVTGTITEARQETTRLTKELQMLRDVRKQLSDREEQYKEIDTQIMRLNNQKQKCHTEIEFAGRSNDKRLVMSNQLRNAQLDLVKTRDERPDFEDILHKKEDEQIDLNARLSQRRAKHEQDRKRLPYLQFWEKGFSNSGLKSFILDNITPLLESSANRFSRIMLGDEFRVVVSTQSSLKTGEAREKLDIQVLDGLGDNIFEGSSAGERSRINLCIALSLQELISSRHKRALGLAFFDEVMSNLDTEGLERFIELLKLELQHKGTIIVISHHPELQMYFENIVAVEKKNGESILRQVK